MGAALSLIVLALIGRFGIPELLLALLLLPGIGLGEGYFGSASVAQGLEGACALWSWDCRKVAAIAVKRESARLIVPAVVG